jgi:hypothetical protein
MSFDFKAFDELCGELLDAPNQMVDTSDVEAEGEVFEPQVDDELADLEYRLYSAYTAGEITHYELEAEMRRAEMLITYGEILPHAVGQLSLNDIGLDS